MPNKLLVYMIDGVAADHYRSHASRFPYFHALAERGLRVVDLHAEALGTSLPGRTSMLTGVTADQSGVYGNKIWDTNAFRYATPDDIRVPTLPQRAKAAGLRTACLNAGMIRPDDVEIMMGPWWARGDMIQRARDLEPTSAGAGWLRVMNAPVPAHFAAICQQAGLPTEFPAGMNREDQSKFPMYGVMADQLAADWVGVLAASPAAPDLIWAEYLMPDYFQHYMGYKSELAHWSVEQADMALGRILARLRAAGVEEEWNIAVMSDHGHSHMELALYPQVIIPGVTVQCEGGSLLVAPKDAAELQKVEERLADFGAEPFPNECVPPELREQIFVFVAPHQTSFEDAPPGQVAPTGKPKAISTSASAPARRVMIASPFLPGPMYPRAWWPKPALPKLPPPSRACWGCRWTIFPLSPSLRASDWRPWKPTWTSLICCDFGRDYTSR